MPKSESMDQKTFDGERENICILCFKAVEVYSIGQCDHPVCYECSARMRVLCRQNECPICRQDMPIVAFTKVVKPYQICSKWTQTMDQKYNICFDSEDTKGMFLKLLEHNCRLCPDKSFSSFVQLKDHVRRSHHLSYCDLCVENLKIFSFERKYYSRQDLVQHRKRGDPDDKSHKGHPLCEFCDIRYMDNDELYRHLRKDHLYCHICDADGLHQYYNTYGFLREHYKKEHFLCEEGSCVNEQFTGVFRTLIDLKAHKRSQHGHEMGKHELKQTRAVAIDFTLAPRPTTQVSRGHDRNEDVPVTYEEPTPRLFQIGPNTDSIQEFPCLGGSSGMKSGAGARGENSGVNRMSSLGRPRNLPTINDQNFPALGPTSSSVVSQPVSKAPPMSSKLQKPNNTPKTPKPVTQPRRPANPMTDSFPALGEASMASAPASVSNWAPNITLVRPEAKPPAPSNPRKTFVMDTAQFPSLSSHANNENSTTTNTPQPPDMKNFIEVVSRSKKKSKTDKSKGQSNGENMKSVKKKDVPKSVKNDSFPNLSSHDHFDPASFNMDTGQFPTLFSEQTKKSKEPKTAAGKKQKKNEPKAQTKEVEKPKKKSKGANKKALKLDENDNQESSKISNGEQNANTLETLQNGQNGGDILSTDSFNNLSISSRPPPGFAPTLEEIQSLGEPPGLQSTVPPPGFETPVDYLYCSPKNFPKRNKKLLGEVLVSVGGEDYLTEFRQVSTLFRSGVVSPSDYLEHCSNIMGRNAFDSLFPELLALLPDIKKQQELWSLADDTVKRKLFSCEICSQVLSISDLCEHEMYHVELLDSLDSQQFPPL